MPPSVEMIPDITRAEWMRTRGGELYGTWFDALFAACETDPDTLGRFYPERPPLDEAIDELTHDAWSPFPRLDREINASSDLLIPHAEEIMTYTSAADFLRYSKATDPVRRNQDAVILHIYESLGFGLGITTGIANDILLERAGKPATMASKTPAERAEQYADIIKLLRNPMLHQALSQVAFTGFNILSAPCSTVEYSKGVGSAYGSGHAWRIRAQHCGVDMSTSGLDMPRSIIALDESGNPSHVRPEVITTLHRALRDQNRTGFDSDDTLTAGNLVQFKNRVSSGCPVGDVTTMQRLSTMSAMALQAIRLP